MPRLPLHRPDVRRVFLRCETLGPILMGMSKPVHILSRDAEVEEIVNLAAIAVVDAQEGEIESWREHPTRQAELPVGD